jgi:hypothetical protein
MTNTMNRLTPSLFRFGSGMIIGSALGLLAIAMTAMS